MISSGMRSSCSLIIAKRSNIMRKLIRMITLVSLSLAFLSVDSPQMLSQPIFTKNNANLTQSLPIKDTTEADFFALMKAESLGNLKIDLLAKNVIQLLGNPVKKDSIEYWAGDGLYHQYWYYPSQGITLSMASETEKGQQRIAFIKLVSPSTLQSQRGIKIGSSIEEVILAYIKEQEQETSIPGQTFVAGSIYGGLIFTFENGYVSQIFLGAAAE